MGRCGHSRDHNVHLSLSQGQFGQVHHFHYDLKSHSIPEHSKFTCSMSLKPSEQDGDTLDLTIRFSSSLPDLLLVISTSNRANTSTLKQKIRTQLPLEYANRRLRLIYSGRALADDAPLASIIKKPSQPPSRVSTPILPTTDDSQPSLSAKAKGKTPIREPPSLSRIYIHCSVGDALTSTELDAEATLAQPTSPSPDASPPTPQSQDASTAPALRGFDRLLSSGFSGAEVQALRLQFLAIQAHTHTPDTMPSPNTLRNMEDQWLDNSNDAGIGSGMGGGVVEDEAHAGALDDMLWGTAMGFFWPIGCLMWAVREEGIWSQRRKLAVVVGLLLNVGLGFVRYTR